MTSTRWIVAGVWIALALPARAQDDGVRPRAASQYVDERGGLSLNDALARALEREPLMQAVRADLEATRALSAQAALRRNPSLTFERREEPGGTDTQTSVGLQWPLDLFRRDGRVRTTTLETEAAGFAVLDRERLLASQVRLQYGLAAAAVRDVTVAQEVVAAAQRQLDLARARVDTGRTPAVDRDLLDVDLQRFEAMRVMATGRADAAFVELRRLLGMAPEEPLRLRDSIEVLVARPSSFDEPSIDGRADVLEARARVAAADARIDQAVREGRFDVNLFVTYMQMDAGFPQRGVGAAGTLERVRGQFHYVVGGAMVMLPLFDRNQGGIAAARAGKTAAEARRQAADLAAGAEVAAARATETQARAAVGLYAARIRPLARQNLDVIRQSFDLGRANVFDVLAEQRRFLEIEQAYTVALREAWEARVALMRALGATR